jgi:hypothetical protein
MAQVAPKIARFELRYETPDNTLENVFYVQCTGARWVEADMDAVKAAFVAWFTASGSQQMSDTLGLYEVVATDLTDLNGIRKSYAVSPALLGNISSAILPLNVTWAIKASIGKRGRGITGRTYWPGLCVDQVSADQMDGGAANTIIGYMNALKVAIAAVPNSEGLVVPHFIVGKVRPPVVTADPVQGYLFSDLFLDSQRDRLPFHKKHKRPPAI